MDKQFGVATKAVISNDGGEYLVLKKSSSEDINPDTYDLPGGRIEFGEKPEDALRREVKEETGLEVNILTLFNTWSFQKDDNFQLIGIDFICKLNGGKEALSDEHTEFVWVSPRTAKEKDMPGWLVKTLEKADKYKVLLPNS